MKKDFLYYVLYLFGSFIPFYVIFSHFSIVEEPIIIYLSVFIASVIVGIIERNERINKYNLFIIIGSFISLIIHYEATIYSIIHIYNSIINLYNKNNGINISKIDIYINKSTIFSHVWLFVMLVQLLLSNVMISLQNKQKFGRLFILTLIFALPILLVQIKMDWVAWVLLITYWLLLYVFNYFKNSVNHNKLLKISILILLVLSMSCTIFTGNFSETKLKKYYNPVTIQEDLLDKINEIIQKISQTQVNQKEVNLMNAKDRVYVDAKHLEVETSHVESMYLKYYSGEVYEENTWTSLRKEKYENMDYSLEKSFHWITKFTFEEDDVNEVTITDYRRGNTFSLYPYYMRNVDQSYDNYFDMYMVYPSKTATFQVWDTEQVNKSSQKDFSYINFIKQNYTKVPDHIYRLFKYELEIEEEDLTVYSAKNKILSFLDDYFYTLSPGNTPAEWDFVDYFLTENKKGYCVHFATVATLMFRYYGIPARYVEGYYVSSSQFDSNNKATVLDRNAHAWVEVFDNDLGWVPIEVTVGQQEDDQNNENPDNPVNPIAPNRPTNPNNPNNQTNQTQQNNQNINQEPTVDHTIDLFELISEYLYIILFVVFVLIYYAYRKLRIYYRNKKFSQKDRKQAVCELYQYLIKINKYSLVMNDDLIQLFEKNKFSKDGLSKEEYNYLKRYIHEQSKQTYKSLKLIHKIKYKFIDCLI